MGTAMKQCRVCGKEYEACRSANRTAGVFRWQEVACSEECGAEYLRQINESRKTSGSATKAARSYTSKRSKSQARIDESALISEAVPNDTDCSDSM